MEDQRYKESYISSERPKPSSDDLTAELDDSYGPSNDVKNPSDVKMWLSAYPNYEGSSDFPNISKLSNLDNTIRSFNTWLSRATRSFHAGMPTQSSMWLNTSPILLHEDSEWLYVVKTDLQKDDDIIIDYSTNLILHQTDLVGWPYFYIYQETIEDPRKRIIADRFAVLAQREDNWDGYDSKKPTEQILKHAQAVIEGFVDTIISNRRVLLTPFISTDEVGHITVQWNKKPRELHLHITQQESRYLKVWGPNINTEMEEGILNSDKHIMLWEWLTL